MKTITTAILTLTFLASLSSPARAVEEKELIGRIEIACHEKSFTLHFHIRNTTESDINLIRGRGTGGIAEVPFLYWAEYTITPPTYLVNYRSLNPEYVTIPAGKEVLYGSFTMGYPPNTDLSKEWKLLSALNIQGETDERKRYSIKSQILKINVKHQRTNNAQQPAPQKQSRE